MLRIGTRVLLDRLRHHFTFEQWQLGVRRGGAPDDPSGYRLLAPPKDRMWADPFCYRRHGRTYIFVEEYIYARRRGHIAVMELDGAGGSHAAVPVLERPYHLSYPCLLEWQGETYMVPETSQNRAVEIYRCTSFPGEWELHGTLLEDVEALDPTLFQMDGAWWMFVNQAEEGASNWDELHLYRAPSPLGPWEPHPRNPVKSDVRSARPAGGVFRHNGAWIRPAQDCSVRYGHAIVLHRIDHIGIDRYEETEIGRVLPGPGVLATHTFQSLDDLYVVDRKVLRQGSRADLKPARHVDRLQASH
jgi:hypothetical protein